MSARYRVHKNNQGSKRETTTTTRYTLIQNQRGEPPQYDDFATLADAQQAAREAVVSNRLLWMYEILVTTKTVKAATKKKGIDIEIHRHIAMRVGVYNNT